MDARRPARPAADESQRPLLSHSSVLVLSAFLIGLVVHHVVPPELEGFLYGGGAVGLFAYLGLDIASARRRERAEELAQERIERRFETQVSRHLPRKNRIRSSRPRFSGVVEWEHYVNVVRGRR
jgi:hypothetical protein